MHHFAVASISQLKWKQTRKFGDDSDSDSDNDNDNTLIGLIDEVRLREVFGIGRVSGKLN